MITTLTLNPAIDRTLIIENLKINEINRVQTVNVDAGGKGINASKIVNFLGEDTTILGILGGSTGDEMIEMLNKTLLNHDFVFVDEKTRTNIKLVDVINGTCTDINEAGPYVSNGKLDELKAKVKMYASKSDMLILSGNAQTSIPSSIYKDIIKMVRDENHNVKIILDASGDLLKEGIEATPWMIKPNVSELSELVGTPLTTIEEIVEEAKKLNNQGIKYVCVSMGSKGLLLVNKENIIVAKPPKIIAKSTVGAGDTVVGSLAVSLLRNNCHFEALKYACAISAASVTNLGTYIPSEDLVRDIYEKVELTIL